MSVAKSRLLFLAHLLPWPLEGGGQIKSYHTLRILASQYDVTLFAFIRSEKERENIAPLLPLCSGGVETVLLPRGKARDVRIALSSLLTGRSFLIQRDDSPEMRHKIHAAISSKKFAALHIDHLQIAHLVPENTAGCRVILDNHNIEYRIPQRIAETPGGNPLIRWYAGTEWPRLRSFEQQTVRRTDHTFTVSEEDAVGLRELAPESKERISAVPIGVDLDYFHIATRKPHSKTLLSIGTMYWPPNVDAMLYFYAEIWPKIKARTPDARLNIVGARPTEAIRALGENDAAIHVTGLVPDVRPYAEDCAAFIVPLRSGSGMRVKILNAMSMGLPVVSTTIGAEGIEVTHEQDILLADGSEAFAEAVLRLITEPGLGERLGAAGRQLMEERYSWEAVGRGLLATYDTLLHSASPPSASTTGEPTTAGLTG
jgi:polysaccharide biosynthesis protein PslH